MHHGTLCLQFFHVLLSVQKPWSYGQTKVWNFCHNDLFGFEYGLCSVKCLSSLLIHPIILGHLFHILMLLWWLVAVSKWCVNRWYFNLAGITLHIRHPFRCRDPSDMFWLLYQLNRQFIWCHTYLALSHWDFELNLLADGPDCLPLMDLTSSDRRLLMKMHHHIRLSREIHLSSRCFVLSLFIAFLHPLLN